MDTSHLIKRDKETNIIMNFFVTIFKAIKKVFVHPATYVVSGVVLLIYVSISTVDALVPEGNYELTYRVHYTNAYHKDYNVKHNRPIIVGCDNGKNYVQKYNDGYVISTTAPIEVIRYVKIIYPSNEKNEKK